MNGALRSVVAFLTLLVISAAAAAAQPTPSVPFQARALRALAPVHSAPATSVYRPSEILHLYQHELNWINDTRTRNVYENGHLRRQYRDAWEGAVFGEWKDSSFVEHTYAGNLLSQSITYEATGTGWAEQSSTVYTYQNGVYAEVTEKIYADGAWIDSERTVFAQDGGYLVAGTTETWDGEAWTPSERFRVLQDGAAVVQVYQTWDGTDWVNTERFSYPGLTIADLYEQMERLMHDFSDYEGVYYAVRLPDAVHQEWAADAWVDVTRQTTERTFQFIQGTLYPLQETMTVEEWDGEGWIPTAQTVVDYVTDLHLLGLPSRTALRVYDEDAWLDVFLESYILQNDIRRIVQSTVAIDFGEGPQDVSRTRITWTDTATDREPVDAAGRFQLDQNSPNPFTSGTEIAFRLDAPQPVRLAVYDLLGREVAVLDDGLRPAGEHRTRWDAGSLPSGLYLYRLDAGSRSTTRQMVLIK